MDPGAPPGGLDRLFVQYDTIRSHGHAKPEPTPAKPDEPPWWSPEESKPEDQSKPDATEVADQAMKQDLGYTPKTPWNDIQADRMEAAEQKLAAKSAEMDRAAAANQRIEERLRNPNGASFAQDEAGLDKAYNDETATGVYYDPDTRTEYVKGSVTARDWYDDATKIPFWGDTRNAERYQQADKAYNDLMDSARPVDRIVGHSLGGSVALQMQKDKFIPQSRTFGAPVMDLKPFHRYYDKAERYRHPLDPVSIFDRGATWGSLKAYPHTYTGFS